MVKTVCNVRSCETSEGLKTEFGVISPVFYLYTICDREGERGEKNINIFVTMPKHRATGVHIYIYNFALWSVVSWPGRDGNVRIYKRPRAMGVPRFPFFFLFVRIFPVLFFPVTRRKSL